MYNVNRIANIKVSIPGRCFIDENRVGFCVTDEIAAEGFRLKTAMPVRRSEQVRLQLRYIGLVHGSVVDIKSDGFIFAPSGNRAELNDLVKKLRDIAVKQGDFAAIRRHARLKPNKTEIQVSWSNGDSVIGNIIDISLSGIAFQFNGYVEVGVILRVGRSYVRVVRVFDQTENAITVGAVFLKPIAEDVFGPDFQP